MRSRKVCRTSFSHGTNVGHRLTAPPSRSAHPPVVRKKGGGDDNGRNDRRRDDVPGPPLLQIRRVSDGR